VSTTIRHAVSTTIRQSRPTDDAFIAGLARRVFVEYTPTPSVGRGETLLAISRHGPVGFVTLNTAGAWAAVMAIAVDPAEQGRGIGRSLMRAVEQRARARGVRRIELHTAQANLAAIDLFQKLGFRIEKRVERFYARGQNACLMVKGLER